MSFIICTFAVYYVDLAGDAVQVEYDNMFFETHARLRQYPTQIV